MATISCHNTMSVHSTYSIYISYAVNNIIYLVSLMGMYKSQSLPLWSFDFQKLRWIVDRYIAQGLLFPFIQIGTPREVDVPHNSNGLCQQHLIIQWHKTEIDQLHPWPYVIVGLQDVQVFGLEFCFHFADVRFLW